MVALHHNIIWFFYSVLCVMLHGTGMFHRMYQKKFIVNEIYLNKLLLWYKTYFWEQMPILKLEWFGDDTAKWGNCLPQLTQFKWWHHLWVFEFPDFLLTKMTMASPSSTNCIRSSDKLFGKNKLFFQPPKKVVQRFFWGAQDLIMVQLILIMQKIIKKQLSGHFLGHPPKLHYSAPQCSAMYCSVNA